MVHVDIKKLGRIPNGGGHRKLGRTIGNRNNKTNVNRPGPDGDLVQATSTSEAAISR